MTDSPATRDQIVQRFLAIPYRHIGDYNWGTAPKDLQAEWHVNAETYINGVPLILDGDYRMGYLLEIVDRTSGLVRYMAVMRFEFGHHDSMMYEGEVGTFFDRSVDADEMNHWAIDAFSAMLKVYDGAPTDLPRKESNE